MKRDVPPIETRHEVKGQGLILEKDAPVRYTSNRGSRYEVQQSSCSGS